LLDAAAGDDEAGGAEFVPVVAGVAGGAVPVAGGAGRDADLVGGSSGRPPM